MVWPGLAGISIFVAIRRVFVAAPAQNRRRRPRRLLIYVGGRLVSIAIWRWPAAPDAAIAIAPRAPIASVRIVAVVTAVALGRIIAVVTAVMVRRPTIAPLDKFAFDVATLVNKTWSRAARGAPIVVSVGRVAVAVG